MKSAAQIAKKALLTGRSRAGLSRLLPFLRPGPRVQRTRPILRGIRKTRS